MLIKKLNGGLTNRVYQCGLCDDIEQSDVILVRVNGPGTESYIDREKEELIMGMVHCAGIGAQGYCRYATKTKGKTTVIL